MSTIATDTSSPIPPRDKAYPPEAGHYSMNENVEDNKKDTHLAVEDNVGDPEQVRAKEKLDDAAFEDQTRLPGTSDHNAKEEDKGLLQKAIDTIGGVNDEASKEYLAS